LRLGAAAEIVNVNLQVSTGIGPRRRNFLPVGRNVRVLKGSGVDDVALLAAAVVPCQVESCRLPAGKNQLAFIRERERGRTAIFATNLLGDRDGISRQL
jgi:hypothetical protein